MKNSHYQAYRHWRNISIAIITITLLIVSSLQALSYYTWYRNSKNITYKETGASVDNELLRIAEEIKKIDEQDIFLILHALIEIMPPDVKMERYCYTKDFGTRLTFTAQNAKACKRVLKLFSEHPRLKKFVVQESDYVDTSYRFILIDPLIAL